MKRKCNPVMDLLKFAFNKKILNRVLSLNFIHFLMDTYMIIAQMVLDIFIAHSEWNVVS